MNDTEERDLNENNDTKTISYYFQSLIFSLIRRICNFVSHYTGMSRNMFSNITCSRSERDSDESDMESLKQTISSTRSDEVCDVESPTKKLPLGKRIAAKFQKWKKNIRRSDEDTVDVPHPFAGRKIVIRSKADREKYEAEILAYQLSKLSISETKEQETELQNCGTIDQKLALPKQHPKGAIQKDIEIVKQKPGQVTESIPNSYNQVSVNTETSKNINSNKIPTPDNTQLKKSVDTKANTQAKTKMAVSKPIYCKHERCIKERRERTKDANLSIWKLSSIDDVDTVYEMFENMCLDSFISGLEMPLKERMRVVKEEKTMIFFIRRIHQYLWVYQAMGKVATESQKEKQTRLMLEKIRVRIYRDLFISQRSRKEVPANVKVLEYKNFHMREMDQIVKEEYEEFCQFRQEIRNLDVNDVDGNVTHAVADPTSLDWPPTPEYNKKNVAYVKYLGPLQQRIAELEKQTEKFKNRINDRINKAPSGVPKTESQVSEERTKQTQIKSTKQENQNTAEEPSSTPKAEKQEQVSEVNTADTAFKQEADCTCRDCKPKTPNKLPKQEELKTAAPPTEASKPDGEIEPTSQTGSDVIEDVNAQDSSEVAKREPKKRWTRKGNDCSVSILMCSIHFYYIDKLLFYSHAF